MWIFVRETLAMGWTDQLNVEPSTIIGQLNQLLYGASSWNKERARDMCFTFEGEILD